MSILPTVAVFLFITSSGLGAIELENGDQYPFPEKGNDMGPVGTCGVPIGNEIDPPPYTGSILKVGPGQIYTIIQDAINSSSDGDVVQVSGALDYYENLLVNRSIKLITYDGCGIDGSGRIALDVVVENVTIEGFYINNSDIAVLSSCSGLYVINNTFNSNLMDISVDVLASIVTGDLTIHPVCIRGNLINHISTLRVATVNILFSSGNLVPSDLFIGKLVFSNNTVQCHPLTVSCLDVYMEIMGSPGGGNISVSGLDISGNGINGCDKQITLSTKTANLHDHNFTSGETKVANNSMRDFMTTGIQVDHWDINFCRGGSKLSIGNLTITGNDLRTGDSADAIYLPDTTEVSDLSDEVQLQSGAANISDNEIDTLGQAVYLDQSSLGRGSLGNSSVRVGDLIVLNNRIRNSSYGLRLYQRHASFLNGSAGVHVGELVVEGNRITSEQVGILTNRNNLGYENDRNSSVSVGRQVIRGNDVTTDYRGIWIYHTRIASDMGGNSTISCGEDLVTDNNAYAPEGIVVATPSCGMNMEGSSKAALPSLNITGNHVTASLTGIHMYNGVVAYRLYDQAHLNIGDWKMTDNDIEAPSGIYLGTGTLGMWLHQKAIVELGSILIDDNRVNYTIEGIQFDLYWTFGDHLEDDSRMSVGDISASRNVLSGTGGGVGVRMLCEKGFGWRMSEAASFFMGSIRMEGNLINETDSGIFFNDLSNFGSGMVDNVSFSMEDLVVSGNSIHTSSTGVYMNNIAGFGDDIGGNSKFNMGRVIVEKNEINSSDGIYIEMDNFGYRASGNSTWSMGDIVFDLNQISAQKDGIRVDLDQFGTMLSGETSFTMGNLSFMENRINCTLDTGTSIHVYPGDSFGSHLRDNSSFGMGNITIGENRLLTAGHGVRMIMEEWGTDLQGGSIFGMGGIVVENNDISVTSSDPPKDPLVIDISGIGRGSGEQAFHRFLGFLIRNNTIGSMHGKMEVGIHTDMGLYGHSEIILGPLRMMDNRINYTNVDIGYGHLELYDNSSISHQEMEVAGNRLVGSSLEVSFYDIHLKGFSSGHIGNVSFSHNHLLTYSQMELKVQVNRSDRSFFDTGNITAVSNRLDSSLNGAYFNIEVEKDGSLEDYPSYLTVEWNNFTNSDIGLILGPSTISKVRLNRFSNNQKDLSSETDDILLWTDEMYKYKYAGRNHINYLGNHWSVYYGADEDLDGIGDTPHNTTSGMDEYPIIGDPFMYLPPLVDSDHPRVRITDPQSGSYMNSTSVQVRWNGTDDTSPIGGYMVKVDGGPYLDVGLNTSFTFGGMEEGPHTVFVKVFDIEGFFNETNLTFHIDTTPPEIEIYTPVDDDFINITNVVVAWNSSDPSGILDHEFRMNTRDWVPMGGLRIYVARGLFEGRNTLTARATDRAGNTAEHTIHINVDLTPPEVAITDPPDLTIWNMRSFFVNWTGTDSFSGISSYRIGIDEEWYEAGGSAYYRVRNLSDGIHTIYVRARDLAGNSNTTSIRLTVDTVPPEVEVLSPANGSLFNIKDITVKWQSLGTGSAISHHMIKIDGGPWVDIGPVTEYILETLSSGDHSLQVMAVDRAGNVGFSTVHFEIDTVLPTVELHSPTGGAVHPSSPITVRFSEEMDRERLTVNMGVALQDIVWNGTEVTLYPEQRLEGGREYTVTITCYDPAGNRAELSWSFTTLINGMVTGMVLEKNGVPLHGALVYLDPGGESSTEENGTFIVSGPEGLNELRIVYMGKELHKEYVLVTAGETLVLDDIYVEVKEKEKESTSWVPIAVVLALVLLAVLVVVIFIVRGRGSSEYMGAPYYEE